MDIATAKPTRAEQALVPHHLIDVVEPDEELTLAEYQERAYAAIDDIQARGKLPLLVGGTGLYVRAVTEGYNIPRVPPNMARRAELVEESKQTIENLKEEVRDVGDEAERASRETENALELRTRDRYRKLIGKIDSTLKRVDGGDYGYCVDTGEEIGLDRLEARPQAERTIDAQERWEHLQKQMGD